MNICGRDTTTGGTCANPVAHIGEPCWQHDGPAASAGTGAERATMFDEEPDVDPDVELHATITVLADNDEGGQAPASRYGRDDRDWKRIAVEIAKILVRETGCDPESAWNSAANYVVNDSDDVAALLRDTEFYDPAWETDEIRAEADAAFS